MKNSLSNIDSFYLPSPINAITKNRFSKYTLSQFYLMPT